MALLEENNIKTKLSKLSCPFTWDIVDSVTKHLVMHPKGNDDEIEDSGPLELFITSLLSCYKSVLSADNDFAKAHITAAEESMVELQQEKTLHQIIRAIEHVFYATKCFYLYETNFMEDAGVLEEILKNIVDTENFNSVELGGLYGCESVTWSCLKDYGMEKAIDTAKKAVEKNEDCALWHFILAKNLRRQRRSTNLSAEVSDMEKTHFEIAYAMSKHQVFGIYYLQMRLELYYKFCRDKSYREKKIHNQKQVLELAKEIFKTNPTNYKVLLKLARIFINVDVSDDRLYALKCLNAVEKSMPNNSTCFHYYAMLYRQSGDYKEAIKYFKKAADYNNFVAELCYVEYGWEVGELEPLPHLLKMLKKYNDLIKEREIALLLAIATTYYSVHKDIPNAGKYFLKALEVDPRNKKFQVYYKFLDFSTQSLSFFLEVQFCRFHEKKCEETCKKIKALLNRETITDLTDKFQGLASSTNDSNTD